MPLSQRPLTEDEAEKQGGKLVQDGTRFQCETGKCCGKTSRNIKNALRDVKSHVTKHHSLEKYGFESTYQQFMKDKAVPFLCPSCSRNFTSASKLDSHRRNKHHHRVFKAKKAKGPEKTKGAKATKA